MAVTRTLATEYLGTTSSTTHNVGLPAVVAGERWWIITINRSTEPASLPEEWTEFASVRASTSGTGAYIRAFYRDPNGTEGNNVTVTLSATGRLIAWVYRLSGHSATVPTSDTANTNTTDVTTLDVTTTGIAAETATMHVYAVNTSGGGGGDATITLDTGVTEDIESFVDNTSGTTDLNAAGGWKDISANEVFSGSSSIAGRTATAVLKQLPATGGEGSSATRRFMAFFN